MVGCVFADLFCYVIIALNKRAKVKAMDISLKNVKYIAANSLDSHCFSATVYVDGKKSFVASDDGCGGNIVFSGVPKHLNTLEMSRKLFDDSDCTKEEARYLRDNYLEVVIGNLVNDFLARKEALRILKRISYIHGGEIYSFKAKFKPTPENLAKVKQLDSWKKGSILLNELPKEEAIAAIRAAL